jgi:hypothetical protein
VPRVGAALVVVALAAVALVLLVNGPDEPSPPSEAQAAPPAQATCDPVTEGTTKVAPTRDAVVGPLVLIGARQTQSRPPDAFDRQGYKLPVTLPEGMTATLVVPEPLRGRVGLVFSRRAQDAVLESGMRGADSAVRFTACEPDGAPGRSGWPGGLVVDRPRCVTLLVKVPGEAPDRRRVPLGGRC